jgi:DNA-binding transcriptional ArsR family regulator
MNVKPSYFGRMTMPASKPQDIDLGDALKALANPVRRQIVKVLLEMPDGKVENCSVFDVPVSKSTLTQHIHVLDESGVVDKADLGNRCSVTLRLKELDQQLPGLLDLVREEPPATGTRR